MRLVGEAVPLQPIRENEIFEASHTPQANDPICVMVFNLLLKDHLSAWPSDKARALEYLRAVLILSAALPDAARDLYSIALVAGVWNNFSQMKVDAAYILREIDN